MDTERFAIHPEHLANLLAFLSHEYGEGGLTNLKLQKLMYYCQGFSLAVIGEQMFASDFQAWQHGPVLPQIYTQYKDNSEGKPIARPIISIDQKNAKVVTVARAVTLVLGNRYDAVSLMNRTHSESPWLEVYKGKQVKGQYIEKPKIASYFRALLSGEASSTENQLFDALAIQFLLGDIEIGSVARRLDRQPFDVAADFENLGFSREISVIELPPDKRRQILSRVANYDQSKFQTYSIDREVIASQRIEGIDARSIFSKSI